MKTSVAILFSLIPAASTQAQLLSGGVNVGPSFDPRPSYSNSLGWTGGAFCDLDFEVGPSEIGFRLGLNYELKRNTGPEYWGSGVGEAEEATSIADYLTIPLRWKIGLKTPSFIPYIAFEFQESHLLKRHETLIGPGPWRIDWDRRGGSEDWKFGLALGGGVDFPVGRTRMGLYAKYVWGSADRELDRSFQILASVSFH